MTDATSTTNRTGSEQDQPVLVATDFSDDSRAALLWACTFADCVDSRLILLHVVHDPASSPGFYKTEKSDDMQPLQDVAEAMMEEFLTEMRARHPELGALNSAETRLVQGLPPSRIVESAELLKARLIVVGSRGLTGLNHMLLGSVAERVVELAPVPVVVVKATDRLGAKKKQDQADNTRVKK